MLPTNKAGAMRPGFPFKTTDAIWSSAAVGDLNGDGQMEMAFGSNGNKDAPKKTGLENAAMGLPIFPFTGSSVPAAQEFYKAWGDAYGPRATARPDVRLQIQLDGIYAQHG